MKKIVLLLALTLSITTTFSQSMFGVKPRHFIEDSLMVLSDSIKTDTTIIVQIQDFNIKYTYSINKFGNSYTFQQLDKEKTFTNYKTITGSMYFFGAWAAMVGHGYIKTDKVLHFAAGEIAGGAGYSIAKLLNLKHPIAVGILTGVVAGTGKELYDKFSGKGVASFSDGFWTGVGGTFGSFTMKIVF